MRLLLLYGMADGAGLRRKRRRRRRRRCRIMQAHASSNSMNKDDLASFMG